VSRSGTWISPAVEHIMFWPNGPLKQRANECIPAQANDASGPSPFPVRICESYQAG